MHIKLLEQVVSNWLDSFQTEPVHVGGRIVSGQSGQVDQGRGLQQPRSLQGHTRKQRSEKDTP